MLTCEYVIVDTLVDREVSGWGKASALRYSMTSIKWAIVRVIDTMCAIDTALNSNNMVELFDYLEIRHTRKLSPMVGSKLCKLYFKICKIKFYIYKIWWNLYIFFDL